jgi:glutamate racemase
VVIKKKRIGFFDSGIGGLSLLADTIEQFPEHEYLYLADHAFHPYGRLSPEEIYLRSLFLTKKLLSYDVDLVVVACNTATAFAINRLREEFAHKIVGIEPFINIINVDKDLSSQHKKIAVLTTPALAKSERFLGLKSKLDPENRITTITCKGLAEQIEKNVDQIIIPELEGQKFDFAILGCTHYPIVKDEIEKRYGLKTIDCHAAVVKQIGKVLDLTSPTMDQNAQSGFQRKQVVFFWSSKNHEMKGRILNYIEKRKMTIKSLDELK